MKEDDLQLFHSSCVLLFLWISVPNQSEKEMDAYVLINTSYLCVSNLEMISTNSLSK